MESEMKLSGRQIQVLLAAKAAAEGDGYLEIEGPSDWRSFYSLERKGLVRNVTGPEDEFFSVTLSPSGWAVAEEYDGINDEYDSWGMEAVE